MGPQEILPHNQQFEQRADEQFESLLHLIDHVYTNEGSYIDMMYDAHHPEVVETNIELARALSPEDTAEEAVQTAQESFYYGRLIGKFLAPGLWEYEYPVDVPAHLTQQELAAHITAQTDQYLADRPALRSLVEGSAEETARPELIRVISTLSIMAAEQGVRESYIKEQTTLFGIEITNESNLMDRFKL